MVGKTCRLYISLLSRIGYSPFRDVKVSRPIWPRGQIIRPQPQLGLTLSDLGLDLGLMASGLGLIEIGLMASNIYSAHDIN